VTLCTVYTVHVEARNVSFLVEPQNQGGGGFPIFGVKPAATI
jgi:hypothetical protein